MRKQIGVVLAIAIVTCGSMRGAVASSRRLPRRRRRRQKVVTKNVTVTMTDFHFKLSFAGPYKHGVKYVFKTVNKGSALHNFDLQRVKAGKVIPPGKTLHLLGRLQEDRQVSSTSATFRATPSSAWPVSLKVK